MWECGKCKEEIEDKYQHCWNCGNPKTEAPKVLYHAQVRQVADEPPPEVEPAAPQNKIASENVVPPPLEDNIFSKYGYSSEYKPGSKILQLIPWVLWLAAFIFMAGFTYFSYQRISSFENRVLEEAKTLNSQKDQFVFSKTAPRDKGVVQRKVLPLNARNNEVENLYYYLPDDLRPANIDEVKTILWLDCRSDEVGRYTDNTTAYRDKCNGYLVDKNTSKIIKVQDFLGEMPPTSKQWSNSHAYGKVLPEAYVSFIRENQPESERTAARSSSDSPDHHFISKSELLYSIILLCLLGAVGFGWIAYKFRYSDWDLD